jgi:hypothetical protein
MCGLVPDFVKSVVGIESDGLKEYIVMTDVNILLHENCLPERTPSNMLARKGVTMDLPPVIQGDPKKKDNETEGNSVELCCRL